MGDCLPSGSYHKTRAHTHTHTHTQTTVLLCCLPTLPQSSSDKRRKATVILPPGRRTQTVDRVKTLVAFHVLSVTGRPVVVDCVLGVRDLEYFIFHVAEIRSRHSTFATSLDIHYLQVSIMKERGMINAHSDHTAIGNRHVNAFICLYRSHVLTCSFTVV